MKLQSLTSWALVVAVTGCAVPGIPGVPYRMAGKPQGSTQIAKKAPPAKAAGPSWTEKFTAMIPGSKSSASKKTMPSVTPDRSNDPISIGYPTGPPTAELFLSMAHLSDRGGNIDHARSMYRQALALQSDNLEALLGLARLEDREGRLGEALKLYQQAAAAHPQNAKALNDLGLCYARSGQFPASVRSLDQAVRLQPEKALYRNNIAKVLTQVDRVDEALAHLSKVHQPAIAQYNMGVLLEQRGKTVQAIHFLTAASHIDPQLQPAHALLAELRGGVPAATTNDSVLPTPMGHTNHGQSMAVGPRYSSPTTSQQQAQPFPAETAQVPQGYSPVTLPPIR